MCPFFPRQKGPKSALGTPPLCGPQRAGKSLRNRNAPAGDDLPELSGRFRLAKELRQASRNRKAGQVLLSRAATDFAGHRNLCRTPAAVHARKGVYSDDLSETQTCDFARSHLSGIEGSSRLRRDGHSRTKYQEARGIRFSQGFSTCCWSKRRFDQRTHFTSTIFFKLLNDRSPSAPPTG